jgi:hypothetical protein
LSNHTLMKVEIVAAEWDATTFTHFRPGLAAARAYQKPPARAGVGGGCFHLCSARGVAFSDRDDWHRKQGAMYQDRSAYACALTRE